MLRSIGHIEVMTTLFYENSSKQKSLPENENDFLGFMQSLITLSRKRNRKPPSILLKSGYLTIKLTFTKLYLILD